MLLFKRMVSITIFFIVLSNSLLAQTIRVTDFKSRLLNASGLSVSGRQSVGGISAIEYFRPNCILLVSDHDTLDGKSRLFVSNDTGLILSNSFFYKDSCIESLRYNNLLQTLFYSFENDYRTGVGYIQDSAANELFSFSMDSVITSNNRGIEGISFDSNENLWVAMESGGRSCDSVPYIPFFRYNLNATKNGYDLSSRKEYRYEFDRCSCFDNKAGRLIDGSNGSGVSEILAFPDDSTKMLVMERCYEDNGVRRTTSVKLFIATISNDNNVITKEQELYDFNDGDNGTFKPENLEGLSWGAYTNNGVYTLYVVCDNNFNRRLHNQFLTLTLTRQ